MSDAWETAVEAMAIALHESTCDIEFYPCGVCQERAFVAFSGLVRSDRFRLVLIGALAMAWERVPRRLRPSAVDSADAILAALTPETT